MKTVLNIIFQLALLSFTIGQTAPTPPNDLESEVANAPEYKAAKAAEKKVDGAAMLVQSKILVQRFPKSALAHKAMSDAYFYMKFFDESEASAQKAIQISPKDPIAWRNLGNIRSAQNKPDDAMIAYKTAVNSAKNDPVPLASLGVFYGLHGYDNLAEGCANSTIKLLSSSKFNDHNGETPEASVWREVACVFLALKRPIAAISKLKRSIALQPDDHMSWLTLALAYSQSGDQANAIAAAQQAVQLAPDSEDAKLVMQTLTTAPASVPPPSSPQQEQPVTLEEMQQIVSLMTDLQQMSDTQNKRFFDTIQQLQKLNGAPGNSRTTQSPDEANAWWQEFKTKQSLHQMQMEIESLRQQQHR